MSGRHRLALEPRLLSQDEAATYCGLSAPTFKSACPVIPIKIRSRVLYDRRAVDAWVDTLGANQPSSSTRVDWLRRLDDADALERH